MKQIKIEDEHHALLARHCSKAETYGQCIYKLLEGEPFVQRLKEVLPKTVERVENMKKTGQPDGNAADDLIRVCGWIIYICEQRSR